MRTCAEDVSIQAVSPLSIFGPSSAQAGTARTSGAQVEAVMTSHGDRPALLRVASMKNPPLVRSTVVEQRRCQDIRRGSVENDWRSSGNLQGLLLATQALPARWARRGGRRGAAGGRRD